MSFAGKAELIEKPKTTTMEKMNELIRRGEKESSRSEKGSSKGRKKKKGNNVIPESKNEGDDHFHRYPPGHHQHHLLTNLSLSLQILERETPNGMQRIEW
ncbi:hypothetical protein TorRG33x02_265090 [Trema orientale]|uniref:Uncharacterized protein n=1 Tax=Trema orientale TaxID=63057 RepID=A0A2P5D227_TREOI|nr:hypothetical protein TorRG33x02_265090 [Trema orientale]